MNSLFVQKRCRFFASPILWSREQRRETNITAAKKGWGQEKKVSGSCCSASVVGPGVFQLGLSKSRGRGGVPQFPQHCPLLGWLLSWRSTPRFLLAVPVALCGSFFGSFLAKGRGRKAMHKHQGPFYRMTLLMSTCTQSLGKSSS